MGKIYETLCMCAYRYLCSIVNKKKNIHQHWKNSFKRSEYMLQKKKKIMI